MTISRGIAATVLVALLAACSGSGEGAAPQTSVTAIAVTASASATPVPVPVSPSAKPVVTTTVTVRATPTPTKKKPVAAPAKTFCPFTAAKLTSLTKTPFDRIGIGPEEPLEEPPGVKATGCTFASDGPSATTITFLTGFGKDGDKLWTYVPTTCKGAGGSIITLGISIKNCTVAGVVRRSVVHLDGSVVWIDFNLPDEGSAKLSATFPGVVNATLNG